jgi:hypothetical protein
MAEPDTGFAAHSSSTTPWNRNKTKEIDIMLHPFANKTKVGI